VTALRAGGGAAHLRPNLAARNTGLLAGLAIARLALACPCAAQESATPAGNVNAARIKSPGAEPDQWLLSGRDWRGTYYSPLSQIKASNVRSLGFAWQYALGTNRGVEATPVVVDGRMFASSSFGRVYALDAATGREIWQYDPHSDGQWARYACCDAVNRGLAVWKGRVYVASLDGWLHALDARTGKLIWKVDTLIGRERHLPYTVSGAPVIAGDAVVIGNAGADFAGVRGYVSAYDVGSGALKWRFFTVPRDPALGPQDQPHLVAAVKTWDLHHEWKYGGGGTVWDGLSYDPGLHLVFVGTGNASPYSIRAEGRRGGDDVYTASIVAIHAQSGRLAWYYQVVPADQWDYDSTQKMILADLNLGGRLRHVLMQASKDGFFYVLDRTDGKLISAKNFAYVNWTTGLDPVSGRPRISAAADYMAGPKLIFPSSAGAHSWNPMSYDLDTGLVYIPTLEAPMVYIETSQRPVGLIEGNFTVAGLFPEDYDPSALAELFGKLPTLEALSAGTPPGSAHTRGVLRAWDPIHGKIAWEHWLKFPWAGGLLSTAGNLVFEGDAGGAMRIYAADTGHLLATLDLGTSIVAAPMTYSIHGVQYVAVMAGYGGGAGLYFPFPENTAAYKYGNAGRIIALKLDGGAVPKPAPVPELPFPRPAEPRRGTPAEISRGAILYTRFCSRCHVFGRGMLPDLRRLDAATDRMFYDIVLRGALQSFGMARWDDVLSQADAQAIHAYLLDESWKEFDQEHH
jgi:quinohemoprotein ethanol dehydrogenase